MDELKRESDNEMEKNMDDLRDVELFRDLPDNIMNSLKQMTSTPAPPPSSMIEPETLHMILAESSLKLNERAKTLEVENGHLKEKIVMLQSQLQHHQSTFDDLKTANHVMITRAGELSKLAHQLNTELTSLSSDILLLSHKFPSKKLDEVANTSSMMTDQSMVSFAEAAHSDDGSNPSKKPFKRKLGTIELPGYKNLKKLKSGRTKLDFMVELEAYIPDNISDLTEAARSFVHGSLNPVLRCLKHHFCGNKELFLRKYGDFSPSTFKRQHCKGTGDECCPHQ